MSRQHLIVALGGTILIGLIVLGLFISHPEFSIKDYIPPQWKDFDDLTFIDKTIAEDDSVYGNYFAWVGTNSDAITWKLFVDKSNKFAIKVFIEDSTGFFTKIPGNISYSGRWTEDNDKLVLQFYFPPPRWTMLFDSLKNDNAVKILDSETVEIDKNVEALWIVQTECKKVK